VRVDEASGGEVAILEFTRCLVNGQDMEPSDVVIESNPNGTIVLGQRLNGTVWEIGVDGAVRSVPAIGQRPSIPRP